MRRASPLAAALALTAVSLWLVYAHTREDSLSTDEPIHILSGWFMAVSGSAIANIEHPPLMKVLSGLALAALPLEPPPEKVPMRDVFATYGRGFFFANRVPVDVILAAARAPFLAVLAALLLTVFFTARARYGAAAGLFALALCAFDPNLVAHAGLVHTDLGAALTFLTTVLAWDAASKRPTTGRLALAALCLGLAFATKFSSVYLPPILLVQTLLAARSQPRSGRALARSLLRLGAVCLGALVLVFLIYAAVTRRMVLADQKQILRELDQYGAPQLAAALAALADFSMPLAQYLGGLACVIRQNAVGGGVNYLFGRLSTQAFPQYFFVAFAVKSTLAFLAVTAAVLFAAIRWRADFWEETRLFLVPVGVLFLVSLGSTYNIGIRHMLPVYPFLALAGAAVFGRLWRQAGAGARPGARAAAFAFAALPLICALEILRIHPFELSYFNALAGGPEKGRFILTDSNVDWGLDLRRLGQELARRGVADPTVAYFGNDTVLYRIGVPDYTTDPKVRGRLVAISAFYLAAGPEFLAFHGAPDKAGSLEVLRRELAARGKPAGRVGYSIYLYDLPPEPAAAGKGAS